MALKIGFVVLALVALAASMPQLDDKPGGTAGGEKTEDPNDPKYYELAQESLNQFVSSSGGEESPKPVQIQKVVTQVVAGTLTKIDFTAAAVNDPDNVIQCHADVWERPWLKKKDIKIACIA